MPHMLSAGAFPVRQHPKDEIAGEAFYMVNIMSAWNDDIKCYLITIDLIDNSKAVLKVPELNKPDMEGCIRMVKLILPQVKAIAVMNNSNVVSRYIMSYDDNWHSVK